MPRLEPTQANRSFSITTPLGKDVLLFHSMSASEQLGRLFQFDLDLLSNDPEINLHDILGQNVTVRYQRPDGEDRYFNGFVNQFSQAGSHGNLFVYRATLRPWFWFLTRTADCRIFQNMIVPDIIKDVFREHGFSDFEEALSGTYREWENCVQYRETDFNFISRLMEQEGIYYYFKHEDGKHTLVISDSISAHETVSGYEEIPYYPPEESERRERDHIYDWSLNQNIQPGDYVLNDFDFKKPKANLEVKSSMPREHDKADFEIYDYPGEYKESSEGDEYVRARIEELQAQYEQVQGQGNVGGLSTGSLFTLINYPREDQNREYLITAANYNLGPQEYESAYSDSGSLIFCSITAIDKQQAFRAPRITPKPVVQGPQTAIVVGKSGEEIWTDKYGRVKVQFHWDRYGKDDEKSSCWIRVSHPWAGKNWGAVAIPRMGQEVIVSFLEGDPDQPIITGRVYNDDNMPPYELPANATQSGVKTRSSKDGTGENFNEIRFEDKKGSEEVYIHAEKDQKNHVENDETIFVGHDRTMKVDNDLSDTITNNKTIEVGVNHTEKIGGNMELEIAGSQKIQITGNKEEIIGGPQEVSTTGARTENNWSIVSKFTQGFTDETYVGAKNTKNLAATNELFVGVKVTNQLAATFDAFVGFKSSLVAAAQVSKTVGPNLSEAAVNEIKGKAEVKIHCGGSSISIKPGSITIKSSVIILEGDTIQLRGDSVTIPDGEFWVKGGDVHIPSGIVDAKNIKG